MFLTVILLNWLVRSQFLSVVTFLDQAIPVWVRISAFRLENHISDTNSGIGIFNPRKYTQTPPRSV